jgi:hypothetical protein
MPSQPHGLALSSVRARCDRHECVPRVCPRRVLDQRHRADRRREQRGLRRVRLPEAELSGEPTRVELAAARVRRRSSRRPGGRVADGSIAPYNSSRLGATGQSGCGVSCLLAPVWRRQPQSSTDAAGQHRRQLRCPISSRARACTTHLLANEPSRCLALVG